jgi:hypothetical protein
LRIRRNGKLIKGGAPKEPKKKPLLSPTLTTNDPELSDGNRSITVISIAIDDSSYVPIRILVTR